MSTREDFIRIARSWIGTPYRLGVGLKGVGVDCARFIAECLIEAGLSEREDLGVYSHDWFCHAGEERYLFRLLRHAAKTADAVAYRSTKVRPGDIILTRTPISRVYNHGAIVTAWPMVVHASDFGVREVNATQDLLWNARQIAVFDPFAVKR